MDQQKCITVAQKFFDEHFSTAECAFVAGSIMRGEGKPHSDIDFVILYGKDFEDVRRESQIYNGTPIEVFVHNEQAQDYFFAKDIKRGMCVMPSMVAEGHIIGRNITLGQHRQEKAKNIIKQGPPVLELQEMNRRKYAISDSLDDLRDERSLGEVMGSLSDLYQSLGDFYLRAQGEWSGHGKGLIRRLRQVDAGFSERYENAFSKAFNGNLSDLMKLVEAVLQPYGGFYWDGDCQKASDDWKTFKA